MEPALIGAGAGLVAAAIAVLGFWMNLQGQITSAKGTSETALQVAAEAEEEAKQANERVTALAASFALYREQSLEKFVTHNAITEVEKRLVESSAKSEQRLVNAIEGLNKRLDRLIEAGIERSRTS